MEAQILMSFVRPLRSFEVGKYRKNVLYGILVVKKNVKMVFFSGFCIHYTSLRADFVNKLKSGERLVYTGYTDIGRYWSRMMRKSLSLSILDFCDFLTLVCYLKISDKM